MTWSVCDLCGVVVADQGLHATVCHPTPDPTDPTDPAPDDGAPTEEDPDGN